MIDHARHAVTGLRSIDVVLDEATEEMPSGVVIWAHRDDIGPENDPSKLERRLVVPVHSGDDEAVGKRRWRVQRNPCVLQSREDVPQPAGPHCTHSNPEKSQ